MKIFFKYIVEISIIIILTVVLLEIISFIFFKKLTGKSFDYAALSQARTARLEVIRSKDRGGASGGGFYDSHPYLGYIGRPGVYPFGQGSPPLFKALPPFNHFGMLSVKEHPYPYKKKPNDFVVICLGGSVAEQFIMTSEDFLETYLKETSPYFADKNIVMLTFATGGYKQPQQLFALQYALLSGFEVDAVLNMDGFNDIVMSVDNVQHGINPVFPSGYHMGLMAKAMNNDFDMETMRLFSQIYRAYLLERRILKLIGKTPFRYSVFCNLAGELMIRWNPKRIEKWHYEMVKGSQDKLPQEFRGPEIFAGQDKYETAAAIWAKASETIHAICKSLGITYIHILQPNLSVKDSKILSENEKKILEVNSRWDDFSKKGYPYLISAGQKLAEKGIAFYDMTMIFKDISENLYFDGCHFSVEGNRILAKETARIVIPLPPQRGE